MGQVRGVADLGVFRVLGQPNLNIRVDRELAARYGLNSGDVNAVIQAAFAGSVATTLLESDRQFNATVRIAPRYRDSIDAVRVIKAAGQERKWPLCRWFDGTGLRGRRDPQED
jgi:cobalt-zinc-cadmium resistance protein CzcA